MQEFTAKEIEGIVKAMQEPEVSSLKIPLRPSISKVEFAPLSEELSLERGDFGQLKVEIEVLYGKTHLTVSELSELHVGGVISLDEEAGSQYEIVANGKKVAFGELVTQEGSYGIKITRLCNF